MLTVTINILIFFLAFSSASDIVKEPNYHYTDDLVFSSKGQMRDTYAEMTFTWPLFFNQHAQVLVNLTKSEIMSLRMVCKLWRNYVDDMVVSFPITETCPFSEINSPNVKQLAMHNVEFSDITKVSVLRQLTKIKLFNPKHIWLSKEFDMKAFENLESIELHELNQIFNLSVLNELPKFKSLKFVNCKYLHHTIYETPSFPKVTHLSLCDGTSVDYVSSGKIWSEKFPKLEFLEVAFMKQKSTMEFSTEIFPNLKHLVIIGEGINDYSAPWLKLGSRFLSRLPKNIENFKVVNLKEVDFDGMAEMLNKPDCKLKTLTITTNVPNIHVKMYNWRDFFTNIDSEKFTVYCRHSSVQFMELNDDGNEIAVEWPVQVKCLEENQ